MWNDLSAAVSVADAIVGAAIFFAGITLAGKAAAVEIALVFLDWPAFAVLLV